jgi:hypothetical protein
MPSPKLHSSPAFRHRRPIGHAHFWDRLTGRRTFLKAAAGATGATLGAGLWTPTPAQAQAAEAGADPWPIPGGFEIEGQRFHVFAPTAGLEPSSIFHFSGYFGVTEVQGAGTATTNGVTSRQYFDVDNRFMKGAYFGKDGKPRIGTFGFI